MQFSTAIERVRRGEQTLDEAAGEIVAAFDDTELLGVLDGDAPLLTGLGGMVFKGYNLRPVVAGAVPRLGVPGIRFTDGPRGVVMGASTCFPVAIARGATWDVELEEEVGRAIGREGRAQGANLFAGVCINLLRHPSWGRSQETYGDDPVHLGAMGSAVTRGVREHLLACVKHFALNSMEDARFTVDVTVEEATLHEVYLPHFREVIEAGAESVMSAYNSVNGTWCGDNHTLLTTILRDEWGFEGFVMTDFLFGMRDPIGSVAAGQDLEMPFRQQRASTLPAALADGRLDRADAVRAATRLVRAQLDHATRTTTPTPDAGVVAGDAHRALARRVAAAGTVLLRNEPVDGRPVLPLAGPPARLAVIGHLATTPNEGDGGSSRVRPPAHSPLLDALRGALPDTSITYDDGTDARSAVTAASAADLTVVVAGLTNDDEGESVISIDGRTVGVLGRALRNPVARMLAGPTTRLLGRISGFPGGDRRHLGLRPADEALITAVAAANPRTVVILVGGGPILVSNWHERVPALLMAWYPGMEGGRALVDVLLGHAEPGGRLPAVIAERAEHLPFFDAEATSITYDRWWGQRLLDRNRQPAAYPLGFGLGYTDFRFEGLQASTDTAIPDRPGTITATATVTNIGERAGATVVQLYAHDTNPGDRPVRQLVGFTKVHLAPGASTAVTITGTLRPLYRRNADGTWSPDHGTVILEAARFSGDPEAATCALPH